jgi:hypothetical protein
VRHIKYKPDLYFGLTYRFQWYLRRNPQAMAAFDRMPNLPAQPSFMMMKALQGVLPFERARDVVAAGTPVSKLSWKIEMEEAAFDDFCATLGNAGVRTPMVPDET